MGMMIYKFRMEKFIKKQEAKWQYIMIVIYISDLYMCPKEESNINIERCHVLTSMEAIRCVACGYKNWRDGRENIGDV